MVNISNNFLTKQTLEDKCVCGELDNMLHIYSCEKLNKDELIVSYEQIYTGTLTQQIKVFERFKKGFENRENIKNEKLYLKFETIKNKYPHEILQCDPLFSLLL